MSLPTIVALAGSTRPGSYNRAVLATALESVPGLRIVPIDLRDYDLPLYRQELEEESGIPESVKQLKGAFRDAAGFIIASPEHNSSYSAQLKNLIDWCSRAETDDEPPLAAFKGKSALLLAASPGALGGLRGLFALRELLQNLSVTVYPEMLAMGGAATLVADGKVSDERWAGKIRALVDRYTGFVTRLAG